MLRIGQECNCGAECDRIALLGARALLQRHEAHPGNARERCGASERKRARLQRRVPLRLRIAVPVEADLHSRQRRKPLPPVAHGSGACAKVGHAAWNRLDRRAQGMRHAQQRYLQIKRRQFLAAAHERAAHRKRGDQRLQHRLHLEDDVCTQRLERRDVAAKLQRVSEPLLGVYEQGFAAQGFASRPARRGERALQVTRGLKLQARFIQRPALRKLTLREQQHRLAPARGQIRGLIASARSRLCDAAAYCPRPFCVLPALV